MTWIAERSISKEVARSLIEEQFPDLAPARLDPLGAGWDNTAFLVNEACVFRFPRRQIAVDLLEVERRLLPALAPRLPLPIPEPTMIGRADTRFGWPFSGYRMIPGRTACRADLDEKQRRATSAAIAEFLVALHAVSADEAARLCLRTLPGVERLRRPLAASASIDGMESRLLRPPCQRTPRSLFGQRPGSQTEPGHGARPDSLGRLDVARRSAQIAERLASIVRLGLLEDVGPWMAIVEAAPRDWSVGRSTLVHGDLYARHLLVDGNGCPGGVIDWGDVHLGDPAIDLAFAAGFLPPGAQEEFRRSYGRVGDDTWKIARLKALHTAVTIVVAGDDTGDRDLVREGKIALRHLSAAISD